MRKWWPAERKCTGAEGGEASFTKGRFISWHWSANAEAEQLAVFDLGFEMDSESHSVLANECVQLLDDLRLWISRNISTKGKRDNLSLLIHSSRLPLIVQVL